MAVIRRYYSAINARDYDTAWRQWGDNGQQGQTRARFEKGFLHTRQARVTIGQVEPGWIPYVLVDDVRASTDKAKSLGGEVMKDVTEMPDMGSFSIVQDPTGSVLGLWQHNPKMIEAKDKAKETALVAAKQSVENPARAH